MDGHGRRVCLHEGIIHGWETWSSQGILRPGLIEALHLVSILLGDVLRRFR
jgi:hypothetical protein